MVAGAGAASLASLQVRLMPHAFFIDAKHPSRAITREPTGRWFNHSRSDDIVSLSIVIEVLHERGEVQACLEVDEMTFEVSTRTSVRETQNSTE
jgi:hypothetical protein